jgi:hypothetical protein
MGRSEETTNVEPAAMNENLKNFGLKVCQVVFFTLNEIATTLEYAGKL